MLENEGISKVKGEISIEDCQKVLKRVSKQRFIFLSVAAPLLVLSCYGISKSISRQIELSLKGYTTDEELVLAESNKKIGNITEDNSNIQNNSINSIFIFSMFKNINFKYFLIITAISYFIYKYLFKNKENIYLIFSSNIKILLLIAILIITMLLIYFVISLILIILYSKKKIKTPEYMPSIITNWFKDMKTASLINKNNLMIDYYYKHIGILILIIILLYINYLII